MVEVWGRLSVGEIQAHGSNELAYYEAQNGGGSGGHVVIESPEVPDVGTLYLNGAAAPPTLASFHAGGAGVVEFRGTPAAPKIGYLYGNFPNETTFGRVPVGLPKGLNFTGREPEGYVAGLIYRIDPRPKVSAPAVTVSAPNRHANRRNFQMKAAATGRNVPTFIRYRLRPPGASVFGPWTSEILPGVGEKKIWQKNLLPRGRDGRWQVEAMVEDAKGVRSTGKIVAIFLDNTPPTVEVRNAPGGLALAKEDHFELTGSAKDNVAPTRLEFRVQPPGGNYGGWQKTKLQV